MSKKTFRCKLVTPTASLVDDDVTYASIPAWDGLFGVLPGRAPILARLGIGALRLAFADSAKGGAGEKTFVVEGGFVQMAGATLTVLAERATPAEAIDPVAADKELRAAQNKVVPMDVPNRAGAVAQLARERDAARAKVRSARGAKAS